MCVNGIVIFIVCTSLIASDILKPLNKQEMSLHTTAGLDVMVIIVRACYPATDAMPRRQAIYIYIYTINSYLHTHTQSR